MYSRAPAPRLDEKLRETRTGCVVGMLSERCQPRLRGGVRGLTCVASLRLCLWTAPPPSPAPPASSLPGCNVPTGRLHARHRPLVRSFPPYSPLGLPETLCAPASIGVSAALPLLSPLPTPSRTAPPFPSLPPPIPVCAAGRWVPVPPSPSPTPGSCVAAQPGRVRTAPPPPRPLRSRPWR